MQQRFILVLFVEASRLCIGVDARMWGLVVVTVATTAITTTNQCGNQRERPAIKRQVTTTATPPPRDFAKGGQASSGAKRARDKQARYKQHQHRLCSIGKKKNWKTGQHRAGTGKQKQLSTPPAHRKRRRTLVARDWQSALQRLIQRPLV